MDYVKRNRKLAVVLSLLFGGAIIHRTGVVASLFDGGVESPRVVKSDIPVEEKPDHTGAVNLRHFNWPESNLEDVLEYNPFGLEPGSAASDPLESSLASRQAAIDRTGRSAVGDTPATTTQRLKAVYQNQDGNIALVGSRLVRVGDRLDDGSRVVAIHDRRLVLERTTVATAESEGDSEQ
jgi:hypothetical protein